MPAMRILSKTSLVALAVLFSLVLWAQSAFADALPPPTPTVVGQPGTLPVTGSAADATVYLTAAVVIALAVIVSAAALTMIRRRGASS